MTDGLLVTAVVMTDLRSRGLLERTLIVWMGEFGRTPKINGSAGRDHWAACNSVVLAGGGVRAVVEAAGIKDVLAKSLGSSNHANVVKATVEALRGLRRRDEIFKVRGIRGNDGKGEQTS